MRKTIAALLAAVCCACSATAQTGPSAPPSWIDDGKRLPQPKLADIGVPRTIGPLTLTMLADTGTARDTEAQYANADRSIQATIYLYENGAADARLAQIATDHAVAARFGARALPAPSAPSPAGKPPIVVRSLFTGAAAPPESGMASPLTTASAFLQSQFTVVKVRVTGPDARKAEILDLLDRLVAGLEFRKADKPLPIAGEPVPCPAAGSAPPAAAVPELFPVDAVTAAGMTLIGGEPRPLTSHAGPVCLAPPIAGDPTRIVRADGPAPLRIALLGDAGTTIIVRARPELDKKGRPFLTLYGTRGYAIFGPFDRMPADDQLSALARRDTQWLGEPVAEATWEPSGNYNLSINTGRMIGTGVPK